MERLLEGNRRFVEGKSIHPNQSVERRGQLSNGQSPFAAVLCCSDSRTAPEIVFDQGLGDLFVLRVAGNILNDEILGSLEYAAEYLGNGLIVVLGHKKCGAVAATIGDGKVSGHIGSLIKAIHPAIANAEDKSDVDSVCKANIRLMVDQLKTSQPILEEFVKQGKIKVAGAFYNLDTGKVDLL